jgi:ketosteroid isomerase-like protein
MTDTNVALIQSLYAAFRRGEIAKIIAAMAPDATWEVVGRSSDHPLLGTRKGTTGVQEFFDTLAKVQDATDFSPREFYPSGDKIFVLGHYAWKLRKTSRTVDTDFIHVSTVKSGKGCSSANLPTPRNSPKPTAGERTHVRPVATGRSAREPHSTQEPS